MRTTTPSTAVTDACRRTAVALQVRVADVRDDRGQGTVEYVALILLVGAILSAVVLAGGGKDFKIADTIGNKLGQMIKTVGEK
jgi:H+/gluconate symporter-like permease